MFSTNVSQMPPTKPMAEISATPRVEPQLRCVSMWLRQTCWAVGRPAPRTGCVIPENPDPVAPVASHISYPERTFPPTSDVPSAGVAMPNVLVVYTCGSQHNVGHDIPTMMPANPSRAVPWKFMS